MDRTPVCAGAVVHRINRDRAAVVPAIGGYGAKIGVELGGHAPVLVFEDADLKTAPGETLKAFETSGQDCLGEPHFRSTFDL
jgi:hypothetical protein